MYALRIRAVIVGLAIMLALVGQGTSAHTHTVTTGNGDTQEIAHGQNHPDFLLNEDTGLYDSCDGVAELPNTGPAGYGLETAHHGPDQGIPGRGDGCNSSPTKPPADTNEAIN